MCGNDVVELCWLPLMPGGNHCTYYPQPEACDGTTTMTCAQAGYYSGTFACTDCRLDPADCDACPPDAPCDSFAWLAFEHAAVSGSHVAFVGYHKTAVFDGLTEVARPAISEARAVAAVPGGWVLLRSSQPPVLTALGTNGVVGASYPLFGKAASASIAYTNGRVLLAWKGDSPSGDYHLYVAITDLTGTIVVPEIDVMPIFNQYFQLISDGTSFFIAADGKLVRIAIDGTLTVGATSVPYSTHLTWSGTTGYIASNTVAQRFDASGAVVGPAIAIGGNPLDFLANGSELLVLSSGNRVRIDHIDAAGTSLEVEEVGAGSTSTAVLERRANDVFVAWSLPTRLQVALVAP